MVGHRLALRAGTHRLVKIKARIPNRIPQFVGKLIELLVSKHVRLINDHQVKIGTRSNLAASQRTDRTKTNTNLRNVKRNRLAGLRHNFVRQSMARSVRALRFAAPLRYTPSASG